MSQNLQTDIVVIGSGAVGLAAAVTTAEAGAKVMMFEKQRSMGGTSNFFEGIFAVESELQLPKYINYSRDEAFKNIMTYSHWRANPRIVRNIVNESATTISWLIANGVEFSQVTTTLPDDPRCYHPVKGKGAALVKVLGSKAKELGVDMRLGVAVTEIIKEGNKVAGIIFEEDGEEVEVAAKAVIIGTGGYANNKDWIKKYCGLDLDVNIIALGNVDKTGDGIRMAWEIGAASDGLGVLELFALGPLGPGFDMMNSIEMVGINPDLWVDSKGERFCDESISFSDTFLGNANVKFKEGFTWRIFDDSLVQLYLQKGIKKNMGTDVLPGTKPVNFYKEMQAAIDSHSTEAVMGNSVEELAENMGIDPSVLRATVDEYNSFCAKGHDDIFAKPQKFLNPLRGPKFYATKTRTAMLGTMGGIKINQDMAVLDKKDNPIQGLYAGGFDAAGMWGDSYCIDSTAGLSSAFALNSGRIAGRNAVHYIREND